MNKISLRGYKFSRTDKFFFDTNVWMYLLYPNNDISKNKIVSEYSVFFHEILRNNLLILNHLLQYSEFINAFIHSDYKIWKQKSIHNPMQDCSFKNGYRRSIDFKTSLANAKNALDIMRKKSELLSGDLTPAQISQIIDMAVDADINDICFTYLCSERALKFVSHDADISNLKGIRFDLITANI